MRGRTSAGGAEAPGAQAAAQGQTPDVPPLSDMKPADEAGLTLTIAPADSAAASPAFKDVRVTRLLALYADPGVAPSSFAAAGPYAATFEGDINMRLRDFMIFSAAGHGKLTLTINAKPVLDLDGDLSQKASEPVRLGKGKNHVVAVYRPFDSKPADLRLFWATRTTLPEPLAPMVFSHPAADKALRESLRSRDGKFLLNELRCGACHGAKRAAPNKAGDMAEGVLDAPSLADAGARFNADWLAAWINHPRAIWPGAHMPRLFIAKNPGEIAQEAKDIAAYLVTRKTKEPAPLAADAAKTNSGGLLFTNLNCVACHVSPERKGAGAEGVDDGRMSLAYVKAKFKPAALKEFLLNPSARYASNPMPDFRLSDEEASNLSAYLLASDSTPLPAAGAGDAQRGEKRFVSSGCANCHEPIALREKAAPPLAKGWEQLQKNDFRHGCLAETDADRHGAPDFSLTPDRRAAMMSFIASAPTWPDHVVPSEFAERQVVAMRCTACHARDGHESLLATDLDAENQELRNKFPSPQIGNGEGIAPDQRAPILTWAGEKLRPRWMADFIAGKISYKPRYYLRARMPGFGARAEIIAQGLIQEHGCATTYPDPGAPDQKLAEIGQSLVGKTPNQSFGCVQCHAINQQAALAPFEAPAINFMNVAERLREDYYYRWIHNPLGVDPETKMPRFDDADGKTGITTVFDGDARKQYEAIWNYLLRGKDIKPPVQ
ncbi:MAG TPA: c-type cytochrome [Tepidisphaeraceae bacterium]|nr:c-type cytochrome [Tepidisphaeraceae bacterium]